MESRLLSFLHAFNVQRDYFECHEYGEALWLDSGRPVVLKGLIQAAVCLYHLYNGNVRGGWRMWQAGRKYLMDAGPIYEAIDMEDLRQQIDGIFARVPAEWKFEMKSPLQIQSLNLPQVEIHTIQPELEFTIKNWKLHPLDDSDIVETDEE